MGWFSQGRPYKQAANLLQVHKGMLNYTIWDFFAARDEGKGSAFAAVTQPRKHRHLFKQLYAVLFNGSYNRINVQSKSTC